jgi:hypothetical protein
MLGRLRTLRWLAALLLIASPAVGGQVMPLLHPCAVQEADHDQHGAHGASHSDAPDGAQCTCLGDCTTPGLIAAPIATIIATTMRPVPADRVVRLERVEAPAPKSPLLLLPPPTAPPIA